MNSEKHIKELLKYIHSKELKISDEAKEIFKKAEEINEKYKFIMMPSHFLYALLSEYTPLRGIILRNNIDPDIAINILEKRFKNEADAREYEQDSYSDSKYRNHTRAIIVDFTISATINNSRKEISAKDIVEGLLESHDEECPPEENKYWTDERLHTDYNTLSHIDGVYNKNCWIKFDTIKNELRISSREKYKTDYFKNAPSHIKGSLFSFMSDNKDFDKNVFIIMPFKKNKFYSYVEKSIRDTLKKFGFNALRADDKNYSDDLLSNIETYLYGCKFCVAVHDREIDENHNANVALEIGYTLGLKKSVCLLKEKTLKSLTSDLQGRIYVDFDSENIKGSINAALSKWVKDKNFIGHF